MILHKVAQEKGRIDFVMAIGKGFSDEEAFSAIKRNLEHEKSLWDEVFRFFILFLFNFLL